MKIESLVNYDYLFFKQKVFEYLSYYTSFIITIYTIYKDNNYFLNRKYLNIFHIHYISFIITIYAIYKNNKNCKNIFVLFVNIFVYLKIDIFWITLVYIFYLSQQWHY